MLRPFKTRVSARRAILLLAIFVFVSIYWVLARRFRRFSKEVVVNSDYHVIRKRGKEHGTVIGTVEAMETVYILRGVGC
jgi:hypothetical protein